MTVLHRLLTTGIFAMTAVLYVYVMFINLPIATDTLNAVETVRAIVEATPTP